MRIFISGGCKNGKSYYAQYLAKLQGIPLYYVATMRPTDDEDEARIARHRKERSGWGFETLELPTGIQAIAGTNGSLLLDSVTALMANEMFRADGTVDMEAPFRVQREIYQAINSCENIVAVSDYIYSNAFRPDELTQAYMRALAMADSAAARASDVALEVCYSNVIVHKGEALFARLADSLAGCELKLEKGDAKEVSENGEI